MQDKILYRYPNPRLCLSWLPKWMLKSVPTPEIVEVEGLVSGMANGVYISPNEESYQGISGKNGIIYGRVSDNRKTNQQSQRHDDV